MICRDTVRQHTVSFLYLMLSVGVTYIPEHWKMEDLFKKCKGVSMTVLKTQGHRGRDS